MLCFLIQLRKYVPTYYSQKTLFTFHYCKINDAPVRGQEWGRAIQYRTEYTVYKYSEEGHAKYMKRVNAVFKKKTGFLS